MDEKTKSSLYLAQRRYQEKHRKDVNLPFILPSENALFEFLQTKSNKSGYIKSLIRADMEKAEK